MVTVEPETSRTSTARVDESVRRPARGHHQGRRARSPASTRAPRSSRGASWMISALAVVIGGIGVMNTMIISVFDRIREIGVLKAVGWRRRTVMAMVLGEAGHHRPRVGRDRDAARVRRARCRSSQTDMAQAFLQPDLHRRAVGAARRGGRARVGRRRSVSGVEGRQPVARRGAPLRVADLSKEHHHGNHRSHRRETSSTSTTARSRRSTASTCASSRASSWRSSDRAARASPRCCTCSARSTRPTRDASSSTAAISPRSATSRRSAGDGRVRVPAAQPHPDPHRARERAGPAHGRRMLARPSAGARARDCSRWVGLLGPRGQPAHHALGRRASARRDRARARERSRASSSPTSPRARSTRRTRRVSWSCWSASAPSAA